MAEETRSIVPRKDGEAGIGREDKYWGKGYFGTVKARDEIVFKGKALSESLAEKDKNLSDEIEKVNKHFITNDAKITDNTTSIDKNAQSIANVSSEVASLKASVGTPLVANTVSAMTDTNKIYVYTGNEQGYTNGNWYFHNGAKWTSGGVYNATAVQTDKTLSMEDAPADSKTCGDELNNVKDKLNTVIRNEKSINLLNKDDPTCWYPGMVANNQSPNIIVNPIQNTSYNVYKLRCYAGETFFTACGNSVYTAFKSNYRFVCFANAENRLISCINGEDTDYQYGNFTVPENTVWAYVTLYAANDLPMIIKGKLSDTTYIGYTEYLDTNQINTEKIVSVNNKNLLDESKSVDGFQRLGDIDPSPIYKTSDYIAVKAGETYSIYPKARIVSFSDIYKHAISVDATDNIKKVIPSSDGYIRVSYYKTDMGSMMVEHAETSTSYAPYKRVMPESFGLLNDSQLKDVEETIGIDARISKNNILYNKKWCVIGDSFTAGGTKKGVSGTIQDGKYKGKNYVYPWLIGNRCGVDIVQFFNGGRTLGYPSDETFTNSVTCPSDSCYFKNIPEDIDYITFYIGINDSNHLKGTGTTPDGENATGVIKLGTIDDTDTSTFGGAWNVVLTWLRQNRPFAHVGIIVSNGASRDHELLTITAAKKYGYPYINLNGDERTPAMFRTTNPDIPSSVKSMLYNAQVIPGDTHPSDKTHLFESYIIEAWLKTI